MEEENLLIQQEKKKNLQNQLKVLTMKCFELVDYKEEIEMQIKSLEDCLENEVEIEILLKKINQLKLVAESLQSEKKEIQNKIEEVNNELNNLNVKQL